MGTLTGTYTLPTGTPESGAITLRLTGRVVNASGPQIYTEGPISAELDAGGAFTVDLVAVDDPGFDGLVTDLAYELVEHLSSRGDAGPRYIRPLGAGPWQLEDLVWYDAPPHTATQPVPGPTGPMGPQGEVAVDSTITGPQGSQAVVEDLDPSASRALLRFTIPRGDTGPQGEQGIPGLAGGSSIYRYNWGSSSTASDPGAGNLSIQATGGQNRTIAISGTDSDGVLRNWSPLQPGDNFTVTDDPAQEPITGFARYTVTGTVEVLGGGAWYRATALRTDTSGTQQPPPAGTPLRVAAALAGPSGLEPIFKDPAVGRLSIAGIEMGDTGWRDILSTHMRPGYVQFGPQGSLIRRVGSSVHLILAVTNESNTEGRVLTFPPGFRPTLYYGCLAVRDYAGTSYGLYNVYSSAEMSLSPFLNIGLNLRCELSWTTIQPWPTSLPGTPPTTQLPEPRD